MNPGKSIDERINKSVYLITILTSFSFVFAFFFPNQFLKVYLLIEILLIALSLNFIFKFKKQNLYINVFIFSGILYLILAFSFRNLRNIFPVFGRNDAVVGFAEYFEYPIYFDIFLFVLIIAIPFFVYYLIKKVIE